MNPSMGLGSDILSLTLPEERMRERALPPLPIPRSRILASFFREYVSHGSVIQYGHEPER